MENGICNGSQEFFNLKEMRHIVKNLDKNSKTYEHILDAIGKTPMVKLSKIPKEEGLKCDMYAKCEFVNPGGSVKDRIAYRMVLDAEQKGILKPGKSVIVEPTSGNTGIGLALAAAVRGYRCIIVLPEKMSNEKVLTLHALGAEIIRTPTEVAWDSPESNIMVAKRLSTEIPNAVLLDQKEIKFLPQYNNASNPLAHYDGTAEEILWSLDNDVDMVVLGAGTCGTISGIAHKIKEKCPKCVVVGVDPHGSVLAPPDQHHEHDLEIYEVEGIGYDFIPQALDLKIIDKWIKTEDKLSFQMARRLIKEEGLLCGGSSGAAMWGAIQAAKSLEAGQKCVVLLPDNIRNYMTKFLTDQWMEVRGYKSIESNENLWWWNKPLTEGLVRITRNISQNNTTSEAIKALRESDSFIVNIVNEKGSISGIFSGDNARRRLAHLSGSTEEPLDKFTVKKFYKVDLSDNPTLGSVSRILDIAPYVVVVKTDEHHVQKPLGYLTSEDLLTYVTNKNVQMNGK